MTHPDIPIGATTPIVPAFPIDLRSHVSAHPWVITLCAWTVIALGATAAVLFAGDELVAPSRETAEWWWHRPEGLVLGIVALLAGLSAVLAWRDGRTDADKPIYDIR